MIALLSVVFLKDRVNINSGELSLMLVYLTETILYFQWCIRQSCEVENAVIFKLNIY
jgi:hypothetical protein